MKKYFKLLIVALFATLSFTLTSCGDDDDGENGPLVGKWEFEETNDYGDYGYFYSYEFKKDNTVSASETCLYNGEVYDAWTDWGTYSVDGKLKEGAWVTLNLIDSEDNAPYTIVIFVKVDGKKAYVTDEDGESIVWTKK